MPFLRYSKVCAKWVPRLMSFHLFGPMKIIFRRQRFYNEDEMKAKKINKLLIGEYIYVHSKLEYDD